MKKTIFSAFVILPVLAFTSCGGGSSSSSDSDSDSGSDTVTNDGLAPDSFTETVANYDGEFDIELANSAGGSGTAMMGIDGDYEFLTESAGLSTGRISMQGLNADGVTFSPISASADVPFTYTYTPDGDAATVTVTEEDAEPYDIELTFETEISGTFVTSGFTQSYDANGTTHTVSEISGTFTLNSSN